MKNIINFYKKHHKILIISFLLIIVISLLSGTYAMFQRIDKAEYANNYKTGNLQIEFTSISGTINLEKQVPITDEEGKNLTPYKFKITNVGNLAYTFDLKLVLDSNYIESHGCNDNIIPNEYIKVQLNNEEPILLSNLSNNTIISNITLQPSAYINFSLRMWIAEGSPNDIMGKHYHAKITSTGQAVSPENIIYNEPNAPVLADGMIPVTYDESKSTWVKADINNTNNSWYDYDNKKWANAVMVNTDKTSSVTNSKSRSEYMSSDINTEVLEDDILAYYVWIPRYKYKLFNVDFEKINSQLIDIAFEKDTESTGKTICTISEIGVETCTNKVNGNYYTHPAFTLGDTELKGIWVGKFETTGSTTTPTVKPGISSLRNINVASMYSTGQLFRSTDYLTTNGVNQTDAHMMKNIEWGAVAYLKQSIYGLGITDIGINSNNSYYTGGGSGTSYKTNTGQSTTGNITGVYDMSGGAYEYVMGNYGKTKGSSGLTVSEVPAEHIDIYSGTSVSASHLGDALGETAGWYSDFARFVSSSHHWFVRGGYYVDRDSAGVFYFGAGTGEDDGDSRGFRVALSTTGA